MAAPADENPLFRCLQGEMKQHLIDAIDALPERERMVLTLYYYEGADDEADRGAFGVWSSPRVLPDTELSRSADARNLEHLLPIPRAQRKWPGRKP